jgi:hypothetical protein
MGMRILTCKSWVFRRINEGTGNGAFFFCVFLVQFRAVESVQISVLIGDKKYINAA